MRSSEVILSNDLGGRIYLQYSRRIEILQYHQTDGWTIYLKYTKSRLKHSTHLYFDCLDRSKTKAVTDIHGLHGSGQLRQVRKHFDNIVNNFPIFLVSKHLELFSRGFVTMRGHHSRKVKPSLVPCSRLVGSNYRQKFLLPGKW